MKAAYCPYRLHFKNPAVTSRDVMLHKDTYIVKVWDDANPAIFGIGECALFRGLSFDDRQGYEDALAEACRCIDLFDHVALRAEWPSIAFGLETAVRDLQNGGAMRPYPSPWSDGAYGIRINGLVWMGSIPEMRQRVAEKMAQGFTCVKLKIGGQNFDDELKILQSIRELVPSERDLEIRLDANGAFNPAEAIEKLHLLSRYGIHSIEQPIRQGQWDEMYEICRKSPIPIALDEELIGVNDPETKHRMLERIRPHYIILKPALCGGISGSEEWISIAESLDIGWWVTSALESNIGLNAIAQWTSTLGVKMPQGLGTGGLYTNNFESPVCQSGERLWYDISKQWIIPDLPWICP